MNPGPEAGELSPLKRAIIELRELRARVAHLEGQAQQPIAIVGVGLRLPGDAHDEESLWQLLAQGVDAITEIPRDRWDLAAYYDADPDAPGKMYTRHGGFLRDVDRFDADFFGISPREAASMDPQQRLLQEVSWEALENAAISPSSLAGSQTGVFLGYGNSDYWRMVFRDERAIDAYSALGNCYSVAAGRLSYFLGVHGPSLAVDTACSASLVALHLACQSLRAGECSLALAGGVNLILSPEANINFSKARMLAPDGRCKTFDAAADGYVRGEGCGMVVLKPLAAALAEGNRVLAVIRGTAVNQDGRSGGLTAPNGPAQEAVIRAALQNAGVEPHEVSYVEAHGTGTSLGDPIEIRALGEVLGRNRPSNRPLAVGSIKTNVGHLEAAAGIAGLLKVVMALQKKQIPPHLHFRQPSPHIDWEHTPLMIPTALTAWDTGERPRIAGLSSFGFSGTNAHVIVEEAPAPVAPTGNETEPGYLLALSARNGDALRQQAAAFAAWLDAAPASSLSDVCHSANAGRSHFSHRLAVVGETAEKIQAGLRTFGRGEKSPAVVSATRIDARPPAVAFLFTGQGSHYAGMGRSLYTQSPVFRDAMNRCDEILRPWLGHPLHEVLDPHSPHAALLDQTAYAQPALFAVEYALTEVWRSWGIRPTFVMGHSVGEYAAACLAGVFSLEDGLKLIAERGRLMQELPAGGRMLAVFAPVERVAVFLAAVKDVAIAAINGPEAVVISGAGAEMEKLVREFSRSGIQSSELAVSHAFHSPLMAPMLDPFERIAGEIPMAEPRLGLISSVTGAMAAPRLVSEGSYWRRQVSAPVRFADAVRTLDQQGVKIFVEIGPKPVLLGMAQRCVADEGRQWLPSLRPGRPDGMQMLETLQALYAAGLNPDWSGLAAGKTRRRLALPTYPFQRRPYWIERSPSVPVDIPPDVEKNWVAAAAAGRRQARSAPLGVNIPAYAEKLRSLDELTTAYAAHTLCALGAFTRPGEIHDAASLIAQFGIPSLYHHLLQRWLHRLGVAGSLRRVGDKYCSDAPLPSDALAPRVQQSEALLADDPYLLAYLRNCGERLIGVMTGKESPLETLFPGGASTLAEDLYEKANSNRYVNAIAGAAVEAVSRGWTASRPLRLLEVGAGTGGTTTTLLPALDAARSAYLFTDVSDLFLGRAREKFARFACARFGVFDLEKDLIAQGHQPGSFDVIVGANVVHAVRDLKGALTRLSSLLVPGGFLLLVEATQHHAWFDFTTGLIEGWQHFADDLRGDNPLITPEKWQAALLAHGFSDVVALPEKGSPAEILGQHVILARTSPARPGSSVHAAAPGGLEVAETPQPHVVTAAATAESVREFRERFAAALADEREELMDEFVRTRVMQVLRLDADRRPDRRHRLMDLGLDSLMAVQLRNQLETGLGLGRILPASLMFDYPTIEAIAGVLMKHLAGTTSVTAPESAAPGLAVDSERRSREIEALSDAEAEAQLLQRLNRKRPDR